MRYVIDDQTYFENSICSYEEVRIDHTDLNVAESQDLILNMRHCRAGGTTKGFMGTIINRYGNYLNQNTSFVAGDTQEAYDKALVIGITKLMLEQDARNERMGQHEQERDD